jgi:excisionase family DNA binding protein
MKRRKEENVLIKLREFYRVEEAANLLRISRNSVYRLIKRGELRAVQLGMRRTVIPAEEIERLVASVGGTKGAS